MCLCVSTFVLLIISFNFIQVVITQSMFLLSGRETSQLQNSIPEYLLVEDTIIAPCVGQTRSRDHE